MKSNISKDEKALDEREEASTQNILPFFWDLASNDEERRISRVVDLVSTLKMKSQKHEGSDLGKGVSMVEANREPLGKELFENYFQRLL